MRAERFTARLTRRARLLIAATALNNLGSGLVLPLLVVYVTQRLGLPLPVATAAVAITSVVAGLAGPLAGVVSDRIGCRVVVVIGTACSTSSAALYATASSPWHIFTAASLAGIGIASGVAWSSTLASSVDSTARGRVFGLNMLFINVGMGLGALLSGAIVAAGGLAGLPLLYAMNGATFVIAAVVYFASSQRVTVSSQTAGSRFSRGGVREAPGRWFVAAAPFLATAFVSVTVENRAVLPPQK